MAQPASVGQVIQVEMRYDIEDQKCENVLYFRCNNASDDFNTDLLLVLAQCAITHLLPGLASDVTLESVHGHIVSPVIGLEDEWTPASGDSVGGEATGDALPSFVSSVVSLYTARPGRTGRGRMYIGGIPEIGTAKSLLTLEGITYPAILAFIACIIQKFPRTELGTGAHFSWMQLSKKVAGTTKAPYPSNAFAEVTQAKVRRELGTQRRRKLGRGR